jgi:hypothetical protein
MLMRALGEAVLKVTQEFDRKQGSLESMHYRRLRAPGAR